MESPNAEQSEDPNDLPPEPEPGDITQDEFGTTVYSAAFENRVKEFLETRVVYTSEVRRRRFDVNRLSDFYRASRQWVRKLSRTGSNLTRYQDMTFKKDDPAAIPMPVINVIEDKIRNEASRLSRPDYTPYVAVSG